MKFICIKEISQRAISSCVQIVSQISTLLEPEPNEYYSKTIKPKFLPQLCQIMATIVLNVNNATFSHQTNQIVNCNFVLFWWKCRKNENAQNEVE